MWYNKTTIFSEVFAVAKKINIILFFALIIAVALPFFQLGEGKSAIYISGMSIIPGFDFADFNTNAISVRSALQNSIYYLFYIIPLIEILLMGISIVSDKKARLFEILCYAVNFIGFIFTVFSLRGYEEYDLSYGYAIVIFIYLLVFVFKILEYLINCTPSEEQLWADNKKI